MTAKSLQKGLRRMTKMLDRRLHAYRDDLADAALKGHVDAVHFATAEVFHVRSDLAPVFPKPSNTSDLDTEALHGEIVHVFDRTDHWAWGQLARDSYVGYLPLDGLAPNGPPAPATHVVVAPHILVYAAPNAASKPLRPLLFGSRIACTAETGNFLELAGGGFVGQRSVEAIDTVAADYTETARQFIGTPYLWGGKSVRGIDCSGLVQHALQRAGITCPRDTDMQEQSLTGDIEISDDILDRLQKGDLIYWPRHVGMMLDDRHLLHASGTLMMTGIEPVADVAARSRQGGPIVQAVKRLMT